MTLEDLAALGYACGLHTLDEALTMVQMHYDAFTVETLRALGNATKGADLNRLCTEVLGPEGCAREDRLLDEAMSKPVDKSADDDFFIPTG